MQNAAWCANFVNTFILRLFLRVCWQNHKDPQIEPMADDSITRGGIGGLGSLVLMHLMDKAHSAKSIGKVIEKFSNYTPIK